MKVDQLQMMFPLGMHVPNGLGRLCDYSEQPGTRIGCDFKLRANRRTAELVFRDVEGGDKQVALFGIDGRQSLYGYWMYDGRLPEQAPIVYIHHEGEGTAVIANSLEEFLSLLALGYEETGLVRAWQGQRVPCSGIGPFRAWLKDEWGISPSTDGRVLVAQAQRMHPDFDAWIRRERARFSENLK